MTPSETLTAAADRVRDLAAASTPGPWRVVDTDFAGYDADAGKPGPPDYAYLNNVSNAWFGKSCGCCTEGTIPPGTARWIAALSPAIACDLSALLVALDGCEFDAARVIAQRLSATVLREDTNGA